MGLRGRVWRETGVRREEGGGENRLNRPPSISPIGILTLEDEPKLVPKSKLDLELELEPELKLEVSPLQLLEVPWPEVPVACEVDPPPKTLVPSHCPQISACRANSANSVLGSTPMLSFSRLVHDWLPVRCTRQHSHCSFICGGVRPKVVGSVESSTLGNRCFH